MNVAAVRWTMGVVAVVAGLSPWATQAIGPIQYYAITPCRVADTRNPTGASGGPILQDNATRRFPIQNLCTIPGGAKAVSFNVTAVNPTGNGFLTLFPTGVTRPTVSTVNFSAGVPATGNGGIVQLGPSGGLNPADLSVFSRVAVASGTVHMTLDVTGYFQ